jgi:hypothetical protein
MPPLKVRHYSEVWLFDKDFLENNPSSTVHLQAGFGARFDQTTSR